MGRYGYTKMTGSLLDVHCPPLSRKQCLRFLFFFFPHLGDPPCHRRVDVEHPQVVAPSSHLRSELMNWIGLGDNDADLHLNLGGKDTYFNCSCESWCQQ